MPGGCTSATAREPWPGGGSTAQWRPAPRGSRAFSGRGPGPQPSPCGASPSPTPPASSERGTRWPASAVDATRANGHDQGERRTCDARKKGGVVGLPWVAINVRVGTRRDGDSWVGWCPSLQVASSGATRALANAAVKEAVGAWLDNCGRRDVLREALEDVGFVQRSLVGETAHLLARPLEFDGRSYDVVQVDRDRYVREIDYMHDVDSSSVGNGFSYQAMSAAA